LCREHARVCQSESEISSAVIVPTGNQRVNKLTNQQINESTN
jgi:hypothetical protein